METAAKLTFFRAPGEFRQWLTKNHALESALWVGFYKTNSGKPSMTWPESVDEALCFGWIDSVRKGVDETSYCVRFSRRKPTSIWSAVNIKRVEVLSAEKRMQPAGVKAYSARRENKPGIYAYEQRTVSLVEPYESMLKKNRAAWKFFYAQAPSYRKVMIWRIVSAKQEETRLRRLAALIEASADGFRLDDLAVTHAAAKIPGPGKRKP